MDDVVLGGVADRGAEDLPAAPGPVMTAWLVIVAVGLGSYALRVGPLLLRDRFEPSPATDDLIRHAETAALSALAVTSVLRVSAGGLSASTAASLLFGAVLALRGASMRRVVVAGLACQWASSSRCWPSPELLQPMMVRLGHGQGVRQP